MYPKVQINCFFIKNGVKKEKEDTFLVQKSLYIRHESSDWRIKLDNKQNVFFFTIYFII